MGEERVTGLDGLRGVAILLVMCQHAEIPLLSHAGSVGVTVFFVLSGYLITRQLAGKFAAGQFSLRQFYVRRCARLLPALAVFSLCFAMVLLATGGSYWLSALSWVWTYSANFVGTATRGGLGPWSHTWSLAVEEQFYVVWPILLALCWRAERLALWVLGLAALSIGDRLAHFSDQFWAAHYTLPDVNAYALLLGAAMALRPRGVPPVAGSLALCGVLACALVPWESTGREVVVPVLAALLAVGILVKPPRILRGRVLGLCGRVSYGWYLWHYPLMWAVVITRPGRQPITGVCVAAASFVIATASWRYLERPVLMWARSRGAERRPTGRVVDESSATSVIAT